MVCCCWPENAHVYNTHAVFCALPHTLNYFSTSPSLLSLLNIEMSTQPAFHVREAESSLDDDKFVLAAFDSTIPYLASIGSDEMWGVTPFTEKDGWTAETLQQFKDAETYRLTGNGEPIRIFIVDAEFPAELQENLRDSKPGSSVAMSNSLEPAIDVQQRHELPTRIRPEDGRHVLPVGFAFVHEDWTPQYIASQEHLGLTDADRDSCVYIEVMVTDHRVSSALRKGAGAALIQGIKEHGQRIQRTAVFVDGWAGNDKQLIKSETPTPTTFHQAGHL